MSQDPSNLEDAALSGRDEEMAPGDEAPPGEEAAGENLCRACAGSGEVDGQTCPECGGTGKVTSAVSGGA